MKAQGVRIRCIRLRRISGSLSWAGRRRAYGLIAAVSVGFLSSGIFEFADNHIFIVDDLIVTGLGIFVLVAYFLWRKKVSVSDLKKQTNIFAVALIVAYVVNLVWVFVESSDAAHVGDEIIAIFFLVALLLNRFM